MRNDKFRIAQIFFAPHQYIWHQLLRRTLQRSVRYSAVIAKGDKIKI